MSFANLVLNVKAMNNFLINNVPLFNAKNHSKNETFYLASILQGLGDTVNFLGVYNYVRSFFPNVRFVFYADIVWRDILDSKRLPGVEIVLFKLASRFGQENNNLSEKDGENGLEKSFADIRKRMQKEKVFLLSSLSIGRTPESFSAKESLVQTNYRLIGYPREIREIRPYFPILKEDIDAAESFLLLTFEHQQIFQPEKLCIRNKNLQDKQDLSAHQKICYFLLLDFFYHPIFIIQVDGNASIKLFFSSIGISNFS